MAFLTWFHFSPLDSTLTLAFVATLITSSFEKAKS